MQPRDQSAVDADARARSNEESNKMRLERFVLEDWFREHYFDTEIALCESGVQPYSIGELRQLLGFSHEELDRIVLGDSPPEGDSRLRKAIANRWRNGASERVIVTHGSSEAMFVIMNALLAPGDEVVVPSPCYPPLASIPRGIGCRIKQWRFLPEQGFVPDVQALKSLVTTETRMVILNFPNNPTGGTLLQGQLEEVIDLVADRKAYLLWDSAFTELSYDSPPLPDPGLHYERTITMGTLTKTYGMGGLRVGWCLADPEVINRCTDFRAYLTINCSPLTEFIACCAIENLDVLLSSRLRQARTNREIVAEWVEKHEGQVGWVRPAGGVTTFLKLRGDIDIEAFCRKFAREYSVFLLPGTCFGFSEYLRLGFGGATDALREGLSRLSRFLTN
jgi:capreomycidine synthase